MTCARCKGPMAIPEKCWYCMSDICYSCFDEHGHCGHKEADAANERERKRRVKNG